MRKLPKIKANSLIVRLLGSFLIIILLLGSFNFYTFSFFRNHLSREIINYNNSNLTSTTERFEVYFELLGSTLLRFYLNDKVLMMNRDSIDYNMADQLFRHDISNLVLNNRLFLNNLMFHYNNHSFVLSHSGSADASTMFTKLYASDMYPPEFWKQQFEENYIFRVFPAAEFTEHDITGQSKQIGMLLPIIVKNKFHPDMYITAFIDWNTIYHEFHQSINDNFYIIGSQNEQLFALNTTNITPPDFAHSSGYLKEDGNYFFYEKGAYTQFTYINIIPYKNISSQMFNLTLTIVSLLIIAVLISGFASIWLSMRLYNPIRKIVALLQQYNAEAAPSSQIHEFNLIGGNIRDLLIKNRKFHESLHEKNSLLRVYAYMNKIKNIQQNLGETKDWFDDNQPYLFVLYQLNFTSSFHEEGDWETNKVSYFLKEFISQATAESYEDAVTFQIENDQIMTIIFSDNREGGTMEMLERLKHTFDIDKAFYFLTIGVSSIYTYSLHFADAYNEVQRLLLERELNGETQIIHPNGSHNQGPKQDVVWLSQVQDQAFISQLQAGNLPGMQQVMERILARMRKKSAKAWQYHQLADELLKKVTSALTSLGIDSAAITQSLPVQGDNVNRHTPEQYDLFFNGLLSAASELLAEKRGEQDHIVTFVRQFLEEHYAEDITLDRVAEPLRVTNGYLSSYFKEKTGINFIDYLHAIRIRKAKEDLIGTSLKIQDIAARVGYLNLNSFNRMFKRLTGVTPSDYRQQHSDINSPQQ